MSKTHSQETPKRKGYSTPRLRKFGDVSRLTRTGTSGGNEMTTGSTMDMAGASSRAVKQDIVRIGDHPLGVGLYLFRYRPEYQARYGEGLKFGVIAEEVEGVLPEAVSVGPDGVKVVHYGRLGIRLH